MNEAKERLAKLGVLTLSWCQRDENCKLTRDAVKAGVLEPWIAEDRNGQLYTIYRTTSGIYEALEELWK